MAKTSARGSVASSKARENVEDLREVNLQAGGRSEASGSSGETRRGRSRAGGSRGTNKGQCQTQRQCQGDGKKEEEVDVQAGRRGTHGHAGEPWGRSGVRHGSGGERGRSHAIEGHASAGGESLSRSGRELHPGQDKR